MPELLPSAQISQIWAINVDCCEVLQAWRPCLQVSAADTAIVPLRGTMPAGRLRGSTSSTVSLIIITGCPPYAVVYHRRSCFSGRCRTHLERSAAARHVCTLAVCFSQSSEDAPLQTLLSVTPSSVFLSSACEVTCINRTR